MLLDAFSHRFVMLLQIFQDPSAMLQQLLTSPRPMTLGAYKHETDCELSSLIY